MSNRSSIGSGSSCPPRCAGHDRIQLGHGSGGRLSGELIREWFLPHFTNEALAVLGDAAVISLRSDRIAISTDTFVVRPLEFPGGNIGSLAVHGTLNDLAMMGAVPHALAAGFVLEEGMHLELLDRILHAMAAACRVAGVSIVTGDTKVVERGKADGVFVNTTGVGELTPGFAPAPHRARPGDAVIVSGPIGRHGIAVLAARDELRFEVAIESDSAYLGPLVMRLRSAVGDAIHVLRDPTRGGVASTMNEIAVSSNVGIKLQEIYLPIPQPVGAACEMLGLDPLYIASEGILVAFVEGAAASQALISLRSEPLGEHAAIVGHVVSDHAGLVTLETQLGTERIVDLLPGDQLPRIC
ncbi:MAG: hydrogenase expression/formation protein HypE [Gemmatimonadota bacterium]|nr:MAG: hydrogenase expression/formation protein HypE [Gemmatimonadota bacterium]